ncbi:WYL domain-containing protein [Patescibacteria group bacterium AH-259-L07]|nr:WYL domain-containing protein [Patescibacteria group bacterium AH-259-L07]
MSITNKKDIIVLDLETQKSFQEVGGRHNLEKLRVSLAGIYSFGQDRFMTFLEDELGKLNKILQEAGLVVGFNTRKFDYFVLAPYLTFDPRTLPSLDIMQEIEQQVGHRVSLQSVALATLGYGKSGDGLEAIRLFRQGRLEELKKYCLDDVKITRDILNVGRQNGRIYFDSNYGKKSVMVNWQFPEFFSSASTKTQNKETEHVELKLDTFELIDMYQSLLVREAIGELTENDDESGVIEKIKELMAEEHLEYCQQRTKEVINALEIRIAELYNKRNSNDNYYPRYRSKKHFTVDETLEKDITKAFEQKKRLEMDYESAATRAGEAFLKKRQVDIYEINGGYVIGFCHLRQAMRNFRMDRIVNFKILDIKYRIPKDWQNLES